LDHMESYFSIRNQRQCEVVDVMTFGMEYAILEDLKLRQVPLVFVDVGPRRPRVSNLRIDYLSGIRQAVQHVAALRHERIAFITGPHNLKSAMARKQAFLRSMHEIGRDADMDLIVEGNHTMEVGRLACGHLLALANKPTAILSSNA